MQDRVWEPVEIGEEPEEPVDASGDALIYETFAREGSHCGAVHSSAKSFRFYGHALLCEDFEAGELALSKVS